MTNLKYIIDYGIIAALILMSMLAVAVAIERFRFYKRINPENYPTPQLYEVALTKRLHIIATIGSNAPYVGLLGTVFGIMQTFYTMGTNGTANVGDIMTGLALALKATAAGLLVAIPAVILYNTLHRKANELILIKESDYAGKEL